MYDDGSSSASPNPPRKPTVYQDVLRSAAKMPGVLPLLTGAHVVVADEVAKLYEREGDREWRPEDFPAVMPPFRKYFVEWSTQTQAGILFTSCPIETQEEVSVVKEKEPRVAHLDLMGCWMSEADAFMSVGKRVVHLGTVLYFVDVDGTCKRLGPAGFFIINPNEDMKAIFDTASPEMFGESFRVIQERRSQAKPYDAMMISVLNLGLLATSFMHSRSCKLTEHETKTSEVRRRMLRPGQRPEPTVRYRVLEIEPLRRILRTEGRMDEVGLRTALHTVRGHWKNYIEKGMFGRADLRGRFWFEEHSRGDPDSGTVIKDYSIGPIPPDETPTGNPSVPCPGCGRGVKDTSNKCWSCGLVFQGAGRSQPMFGRATRGRIGVATNPDTPRRPSLDEQIRQAQFDLERSPGDPEIEARLEALLRRVGTEIAERYRRAWRSRGQ